MNPATRNYRVVLALSPVLMFVLGLCLVESRANELSQITAKTPADALILEKVANWQPIDLATNFPTGTNRNVSPDFLRWLLTSGQANVNHTGLHLRNAIIEGWLDLENLDIPANVQFEDCIFKTNVNLSGAHFYHNLSFQVCVFDGPFIANALQVDGSLLFNEEDAMNSWNVIGPLGQQLDATSAKEHLTNDLAM
jgi:hypothetical protein